MPPAPTRLWLIYDLIVAIGAFILCLDCFLDPFICWDAWAYHLPFASFLLNIGGGEATYHMEPTLITSWLGFPKMAEILQGVFWKMTGSVNGAILPNFVVLWIYLRYVSPVLELRPPVLFLGLMTCPMVLANFGSIYIDFVSCTSLAGAFFLLTRFFHFVEKPNYTDLLMGGLCLTIAANSKDQETIASFGLLVLFAGRLLIKKALTLKKCGILFALALCCSPFCIKNALVFGNPLFPCRVQVLGITVLKGPLAPNLVPDYGNPLMNLNPVRFLISATEIDWSLRGIPAFYDLDSSAGASPQYFTRGRTGGWNGPFFVLSTAIVAWVGLRNKDALFRSLAQGALMLFALAAVLPVSNELRYAIYVPIITYPLAIALMFKTFPDRALVLIVCTLFSIQSFCLRGASYSHFVKADEEEHFVDKQILQAAHTTPPGKFIYSDYPLAFHFSQAVTGRPYLLSNDPKDK